MNKNRRDQILNMAFGEREPESVLYESLSAEEKAELETLREMRQGLLSLQEVPECQLSSERLRGAILSNAVKKKPVLVWSFAGGAIAFVAVAIVAFSAGVFDQIGSDVARITDGTENPLTVTTLPNDLTSEKTSTTDSSDFSSNSSDPDSTVLETAPASEVGTEQPRSNGSGTDGAYDWDYALNTRPTGYERFTTIYYPAPDIEISVASPSASDEVSGPLIVVSNSIEDVSGAFEATEVETFGDVVFGG